MSEEEKVMSEIDIDAEIAAAEQMEMTMTKQKPKTKTKVIKKKKKAATDKSDISKLLKQIVNSTKGQKIDTMANLAVFNGQTVLEKSLQALQGQLAQSLSQVNLSLEAITNEHLSKVKEEQEQDRIKSMNVNPSKCVFCTLLRDDSSLPGVEMLASSIDRVIKQKLKEKNTQKRQNTDLDDDLLNSQSDKMILEPPTKIQLVVLYTPTVTCFSKLRSLPNLILKPIPDLAEFSLLNIWTLIEYSVVVYLETDCIVKNNRAIEPMRMVLVNQQCELAAAPKILPPDCFDTGVLAIRPSIQRFRELLTKSRSSKSVFDLLNSFFKSWHASTSSETLRLPFEFNAQTSLKLLSPEEWSKIEDRPI